MIQHARHTVAAAAAFFCALAGVSSSAMALGIGDDAPPLKVAKWVKGEPVEKLQTGTIYVVEFWATWCGPCRATIPHVSELQQKYKDVVFIGQNVWERNESAVDPFVTEMGDKMGYRVALDTKPADNPDGVMATTWMKAANQDGIPAAFIVNKEGKIAWIGHPAGMDEPLAKIVEGNYDLETARAQAKSMEEVQAAFQKTIGPAMQSGDTDKALAEIDKLAAAHPAMKTELLGAKFAICVQIKEFDKAYAAVDEFYEAAKDNAQQLNAVAWMITTNPNITKRDLDRALKLAKRAVEVSNEKEADYIDTLARVHAEKGELDKAVECQTKAVAVAGADSEQAGVMKQTLAEYKAKQTK